MQINRRNFLQSTAVALTFIVSSGGLRVFGQQQNGDLFQVPAEAYSDPLFSLTAAHAGGLVGTTFTATAAGNRSVRLTLRQVNPLERQINTLRGYYGESFSLIFESQQRLRLGQGIYRLAGGGLDFESVLLVPTGIGGNQYEVLINHLTR
jgi:hypothetical protein